jgi:ABC-type glycerol-3-phosphate transport system permease component
MVHKRFHPSQLAIHAILIVVAVFTFVPLLMLVSLSLKDLTQFNSSPMGVSLPFHFENYAAAWKFMQDPLIHNIVVGVMATALSLMMAAAAAFVFARFDFPLRNTLFFALMILLLVPGTVLLVPTYQLIIQFGLQNTLWSLILPYAAHQTLIIFVLRTFFAELPGEMFDAAKVDGASVLQLFWRIAIPLSLPVLSAMAIFQVWFIWNDYAWPTLVANSPEARTAVTGLIYFNDFSRPEPGAGMAAAVLASLPVLILFLFTMRTFIAGLTAGAAKG